MLNLFNIDIVGVCLIIIIIFFLVWIETKFFENVCNFSSYNDFNSNIYKENKFYCESYYHYLNIVIKTNDILDAENVGKLLKEYRSEFLEYDYSYIYKNLNLILSKINKNDYEAIYINISEYKSLSIYRRMKLPSIYFWDRKYWLSWDSIPNIEESYKNILKIDI